MKDAVVMSLKCGGPIGFLILVQITNLIFQMLKGNNKKIDLCHVKCIWFLLGFYPGLLPGLGKVI
ncbi:hypothetical protein HanRHA438_Chr03g0120451 [Helianthus annuus]|nr:hypothetical protein HanRHA438_Chr03g0120451 [Helianthus annuus]